VDEHVRLLEGVEHVGLMQHHALTDACLPFLRHAAVLELSFCGNISGDILPSLFRTGARLYSIQWNRVLKEGPTDRPMGTCRSKPAPERRSRSPDEHALFSHFNDFVRTHCELGHDKLTCRGALVSAFASYLTQRSRECSRIHPSDGLLLARKYTDDFFASAGIPHYLEPGNQFRRHRAIVGIRLKSYGTTKEDFERITRENGTATKAAPEVVVEEVESVSEAPEPDSAENVS
jgi:hypothetical protein